MKKIQLLLLLLPCSLFAQKDPWASLDSSIIGGISKEILTHNFITDNLYHLTKKIGGRLAGSPQMAMAENWGATAMQKAGADTVYKQQCLVPHWVRGKGDKAEVTITSNGKTTKHILNMLALGNSLGTSNKGVQAPLIRINNFAELELKKDAIKGCIVFFNQPFEEDFVETFKAYGKNGVYRTTSASKVAKLGGVGVIVRSLTHAADNNPHTGNMSYNDSFPKIPAIAIGLKEVALLNQAFDNKASINANIVTHGKMLPDTIGHNIIGELIGTENPNYIITIGGHLDSWDVAEGAHDDGAGVVQTIEVLRVLKTIHYQPKNTIRFVLFANEENGTRGAKKYAEQIGVNKEKPIFALESDAGGFTPRGFGFSVSDSVFNKLSSYKHLLAPYYGSIFTRSGGGADIAPLKALYGTPLAGLQPDSQRYFDIHHAVTDVYENVHPRELKLGAVNMAALIYLVDKYGL